MDAETVEDPFIGQRFGKDGCMEVVGWDGTRSKGGSNKVYTIKCHECAKDPELFGEGLFKSLKSSMMHGQIPCGCSVGPKWKPQQYRILLRRWGKIGQFEIVGGDEDDICSSTRIFAKCDVCSTEWNANVNCFQGGRACPTCGVAKARSKRKKDDDHWITKFTSTGAFSEGTTFERVRSYSKGGRPDWAWNITCPNCSNDEYVQAGLCTGVFKAAPANLVTGKRPCRCTGQNKWTKEQREYQVNKACKGQTYKFVGWAVDGKFGAFDKLIMNCDEHGDWPVTVDKFVNGGQRCPSCAKGGFSSQEDAAVYILRIRGETSGFTGYGISNVVNSRLSTHKRNLALRSLKIVESHIVDMTGQQAYAIEQLLKKSFPCYSQDVEGFVTEATYAEHYQDVIDFVEEELYKMQQNSY